MYETRTQQLDRLAGRLADWHERHFIPAAEANRITRSARRLGVDLTTDPKTWR